MKPDDLSQFYTRTGPFNIKINDMELAQNLVAPAAWGLAITKHKPAMVIEIGTSKGGLSSLISGFVSGYGGEFHTFDIHGDGDYNQYPLHGNSHFHPMDCFSYQGLNLISTLIKLNGLCFVLCDGGNKPKEFNELAKHLKKGDVISCHDYCDPTVENYSPIYWICQEVSLDDIKDTIEKEGLEDFEPAWFKYSAWKCVIKK